jgi:hypothetical protein
LGFARVLRRKTRGSGSMQDAVARVQASSADALWTTIRKGISFIMVGKYPTRIYIGDKYHWFNKLTRLAFGLPFKLQLRARAPRQQNVALICDNAQHLSDWTLSRHVQTFLVTDSATLNGHLLQ